MNTQNGTLFNIPFIGGPKCPYFELFVLLNNNPLIDVLIIRCDIQHVYAISLIT